jgi:hypothetical protein
MSCCAVGGVQEKSAPRSGLQTRRCSRVCDSETAVSFRTSRICVPYVLRITAQATGRNPCTQKYKAIIGSLQRKFF